MWRVGIDEAGYGPNLGPLVMASVAVRVPPDTLTDLWTRLSPAVTAVRKRGDKRLLLADSKYVHAAKNGLELLERGVWAWLGRHEPTTLGELLAQIAPESLSDLAAEVYFEPGQVLPLHEVAAAAEFHQACRDAQCELGPIRAVLLTARRFNWILDEFENKSYTTAHGLIRLLRQLPGQDDPVTFHIDKQGGRNAYAPLLQTAWADGYLQTVCESAECSEYHTSHTAAAMTARFIPEAESTYLEVAVASMTAKYLREVLMKQFNAYWAKHVPGIRPTAGYPVDAERFWAEIGSKACELGIAKDDIWRRK